jgi:xanthine/uracil/vitamin C permease (AzgA family)
MRAVRIGVAVAESADAPPAMRALVANPARLRVYHPLWVLTGALGVILLAAGVAVRGWNTGLLRDGGAGTQFSLGRVQMGFWLVLSVGGFLFIWLVSGQWEGVVTGGVIALLGISATTGVTARMVDDSTTTPTTGFWNDILGDADGAALHRIQLMAWTVVLGAIFIWTVIWEFSFPDFDTNLLLLAGIAGGTYIGFKFQESATPTPTESDPPPPPPQG